jgi:hypothetical protein
MSEKKYRWFVNCVDCGAQFSIGDAPNPEQEPFPPSHSWKGPCPCCGAENTYSPSEMQLGEEQ